MWNRAVLKSDQPVRLYYNEATINNLLLFFDNSQLLITIAARNRNQTFSVKPRKSDDDYDGEDQ
jgi:hypothetical protein